MWEVNSFFTTIQKLILVFYQFLGSNEITEWLTAHNIHIGHD